MTRLTLTLAAALALTCASARADGERPLGNLLRDARAAETLQKAAGTSYYEGGRGRAAVVEHTLVVDDKGLTSTFVEHLRSGGATRTRYRLSTTGLLESVQIESASPADYPTYTETRAGKREGQELLVQIKGREGKERRVQLPENAVPMPVVMFVLPRLLIHLPEGLELTPLDGTDTLPVGFTLRRHPARAGHQIPLEILAPDKSSVLKIFVGAAPDTIGQILRIEAREEGIRPLSAKDAKAQLRALRSKEGPGAGFKSPAAAVEGLIAACAKGDQAAVGACFSAQAPGEFQALRQGKVPAKDFQQLCQLFAGAKVGEVSLKGDRARVAVQLSSRAETLTLIKERGSWRVLDF